MTADWTRSWERASALAPTSRKSVGGPSWPTVGSCTASDGRRTPLRRRRANRAAAIVAPVGPALTSAWERPSATSAAAMTIEASWRERTAPTGSSSLAISPGEATISAPASATGARSPGSPKTRTPMPSSTAMRTPPASACGPCSAPRPSSATITSAPAGTEALDLLGSAELLADLWADDLTAGIRAAGRAHAMRKARAVAARTAIRARPSGGVVRAPLVAAGA